MPVASQIDLSLPAPRVDNTAMADVEGAVGKVGTGWRFINDENLRLEGTIGRLTGHANCQHRRATLQKPPLFLCPRQ